VVSGLENVKPETNCGLRLELGVRLFLIVQPLQLAQPKKIQKAQCYKEEEGEGHHDKHIL